MAHLAEHRRAVNQLAVASSEAFFVSASNDETVKVGELPMACGTAEICVIGTLA